MSRFSTLENERGNILIVTLLILFGVSVLGSTLASMSSMDLKLSANQSTSTQALYIAEAGLNEAIHRLSLADPTSVSVGDWTGNAAIRDPAPYDPDWEARIYLTAPDTPPAGDGSVVTYGTLQPPGAYLTYSVPSGTDRVLNIRHKWRDLDNDGLREADEIVRWDPYRIPSENFSSGTPIEVITVTGTQGRASRTIQAEVIRGTTGGDVNGATALDGLAAIYGDDKVSILKNYGICGYNHRASSPIGTKPGDCSAFHVGSGDLPGCAGAEGASIQIQPDGDIRGFPAPTGNGSPAAPTCWEVLGVDEAAFESMLSDADQTRVSSSMHGVSYFQDCVIDEPVVGSGLLYAKNLDIRDDFEWTGLVYASDHLSVESDKAWVVGSVVSGGDVLWQPRGTDGNQGVLFSAEAVRQIVSRGSTTQDREPSHVTVLSWREI